jgi:uncharacterized Zn finger protein
MKSHELVCMSCRHVTEFDSDVLTFDGRYEVLPCGKCGLAYMIHKRSLYLVPIVYRLSSTKSFIRTRIEDLEKGDATEEP